MGKLLSKNGVAGRFALGVAVGLVAQALRTFWMWLREPATAGSGGETPSGSRP
jgi:hypothetical protein